MYIYKYVVDDGAAATKKKPRRTRISEIYGCPRHVIRALSFQLVKRIGSAACAAGQKNGRRKSRNERSFQFQNVTSAIMTYKHVTTTAG